MPKNKVPLFFNFAPLKKWLSSATGSDSSLVLWNIPGANRP